MKRQLVIKHESWPISGKFSISRGSKTSAEIVLVEINVEDKKGRGECVPYPRYQETVESVIAQIETTRYFIEHGITRQDLQSLLPAGAARNALDCALWDLEAKQNNTSVGQKLGCEPLHPITSTYTISLGTPEEMGKAASLHADKPLLKIKLSGQQDIERLLEIRKNAPNARLIIDPNESWTFDQLQSYMPALIKIGIELIEQPLPAKQDQQISNYNFPIILCADESCHDRSYLPSLKNKYQAVNIKLDKTGGLTEALSMLNESRTRGFKIMVGCMVGTSLAMAPAMFLAQNADWVDLDGPLLLAYDRDPGLILKNNQLYYPDIGLWGSLS
ncbi:MAG: dipeptide epimerase [Alphaproteobacteria bacterium]|nr:dipeptide epimerase [Alphaproteobacteria bacterium]